MIKISAIEGNRQKLDGGSMFGNAPRVVWEKWTEVDEQGRIPLACRCLLIETDQHKILCEAGIGAFFEDRLAHRFGVQTPEKHLLLENLQRKGISPQDIDYVILSHLHFDHAGGLLPTYQEIKEGRQELVFPTAQFIVGEKAWQRAIKPHFRDRASFVPLLNELLESSGRLHIVKDKKAPQELLSFIEFIESDGHTPGQMHTLVKGKTNQVLYAGDLIPGVPWVHLPITMGYDRYPEKLIEEKQKLYEQFADANLSLFFTHDSEYAMGTLKKNDQGKFAVIDHKKEFTDMVI